MIRPSIAPAGVLRVRRRLDGLFRQVVAPKDPVMSLVTEQDHHGRDVVFENRHPVIRVGLRPVPRVGPVVGVVDRIDDAEVGVVCDDPVKNLRDVAALLVADPRPVRADRRDAPQKRLAPRAGRRFEDVEDLPGLVGMELVHDGAVDVQPVERVGFCRERLELAGLGEDGQRMRIDLDPEAGEKRRCPPGHLFGDLPGLEGQVRRRPGPLDVGQQFHEPAKPFDRHGIKVQVLSFQVSKKPFAGPHDPAADRDPPVRDRLGIEPGARDESFFYSLAQGSSPRSLEFAETRDREAGLRPNSVMKRCIKRSALLAIPTSGLCTTFPAVVLIRSPLWARSSSAFFQRE